ncbi:hypothetical protein HDV05_007947 [Chytridiales sp. JEL 0842]|nr:hypothetical protein HDV05_007947 [Chytridiales sp. JEL 0842]
MTSITLTAPSSPSTGSLKAIISPRGSTITHLIYTPPGTSSESFDVLQGFDNAEDQIKVETAQNPYYGTVGRCCNRIAKGTFDLDGVTYTLPINNGPNSLHGGLIGFDKKDWKVQSSATSSVTLTYTSPHGEEGYPCTLEVSVTFTLIPETCTLKIHYEARIAKDSPGPNATIVNMTNHSYFNLSGFKNSTIKSHTLHMPSCAGYLQLDSTQIPTGKLVEMMEPEMDFTKSPKPLGKDLDMVQEFRGYDHFYLLRKPLKDAKELQVAAILKSPDSGVCMKMQTSAPGLQVYTANWADGTIPTKKTQPSGFYEAYGAVCLEASAPPDAINSKEEGVRRQVVLKRGEVYEHTTVLSFWNE